MDNGKFKKGERRSRSTEFKKGQKPWNTGLKGVVKPNSGSFKKGNKVYNTQPLYAERTKTESRTGSKTVLIKLGDRNWITKARFVWEKETGKKVPKGMVLYHVDNNYDNNDFSNLELITRAESITRTNKRYRGDSKIKGRDKMEAGTIKRHKITLKFNKSVPDGVINVIKDNFKEVKTEVIKNTLLLTNIHGDEVDDILETARQEDKNFLHTIQRRTGIVLDNRRMELDKQLIELDSLDITSARATEICRYLIDKQGYITYVSNNGSGIRYIHGGKVCEKFEKVEPLKENNLSEGLGAIEQGEQVNLSRKASKPCSSIKKQVGNKGGVWDKLAESNKQIEELVKDGKKLRGMKHSTNQEVLESNEVIKKLIAEGKTLPEISKITGYKYCTVWDRVKKLGLINTVTKARHWTKKKTSLQSLAKTVKEKKKALEEELDKLPQGSKNDADKLRYDLLPVDALEELVKVYNYGCKKYAENNWRKGFAWGRVFSALMRHLWAFWRGEELDKESGLPHLSHAAWGCFTLLNFTKTKKELDDRQKEITK